MLCTFPQCHLSMLQAFKGFEVMDLDEEQGHFLKSDLDNEGSR